METAYETNHCFGCGRDNPIGLKLDMKPKDMLTVEGAVRAIMAAKKAAPKTRDSKTGGKG